MKTRAITGAIIFTLMSTFAYSQAKQDRALQSLTKQMVDAQIAYDVPTLDRIFTADYIEVSPVGEFDSREKVLGFYRPELKPPGDKLSASVELAETSIRDYKTFAVIIARLDFMMTSEGKPLPPRSLRVTLVCRKEKASWKIASAQYTGIRPPQVQQTK
jgi:ketosteroid isomerase-like protein